MTNRSDARSSFRDQLWLVIADKGFLAIVALIAGCYVNQVVDHYKIAQESTAEEYRNSRAELSRALRLATPRRC